MPKISTSNLVLGTLIIILSLACGLSSMSLAADKTSSLSIQGTSTVPGNSQSQYTAYFNGSKVNASWSLSSTEYASISSSGLLTTKKVTRNQTVTVRASYGDYRAYKSVTITPTGTIVSLTGLTLSGPSSVNSGATASYTATATFSNNTTQNVTASASWSVSPALGTISSGNYTPGTVSANQTVTIGASYTSGGVTKSGSVAVTVVPATASSGSYQVFAFNDLGMHCYDSDFSVAAVLPLYNVLHGQVILKGLNPQIMTSGSANLTYQAVADPTGSINTTSAGKTNFWTYVQQLFGISLPVDTGIKGQKMPGAANTPQPFASPYDTAMNWFSAEGIPITCIDDANKFNAEALMRVTARNPSGTVLSTLDTVVPASNEMNCNSCHNTGGVAAGSSQMSKYGITAWSTNTDPAKQVKQNVLILHDAMNKTTLMSNQPVLCASCHYSAALDLGHTGPTGAQVGHKYLSRAMHQHHGLTIDGQVPSAGNPAIVSATGTSACYLCHPGQNTQCLRGVMATAGLTCENCHGDMLAVGGYYNLKTTGAPRNPWLDEPKCQSCHTGDAVNHLGTGIIGTQAYDPSDPAATPIIATNTRFAENNATTLYRNSTGMGGVACESCHGSPHAIWPVKAGANDNIAAIQIQGHTGEISECTACHGTGLSRTLNGPHGMHNVNDPNWWNGGHESFAKGNNCKTCHGIDGLGTVLSKAKANRTFGSRTITAGTPVACNMCHANYINGGG